MSQSELSMPSPDRALPADAPRVAGGDAAPTLALNQMAKGRRGTVARVAYQGAADSIAERLEALGFVPGEAVSVVATGPLGGEPIVVLVGSARFALRHAEAARVLLHSDSLRGLDD